MTTLTRLCAGLKARGCTAATLLRGGNGGFFQGRQITSSSLQQLCLRQSNYNHMQSKAAILSSSKENGLSTRNLKTNSSDNIDQESRMPLTHPTKGVLVYTGKMTQYVKGLKTLSLSTSLLALLAQPMVLSAAKDDLVFKAGVMGSISAVVFFTPALVHFVTKKYVTDIYYNKDTKMFTLACKSFFLRRKEWEFKAEDVVIPFTPRMFVTHVIKGRSFFIDFEEFRDKEIYKHMVGYDKPLDLTSGSQENKTKAKKKKKFGLFEDEAEKMKQMEEKKMPPEFISRQLMFDDDDDDWQHGKQKSETQDDIKHFPKEKQKNKMG